MPANPKRLRPSTRLLPIPLVALLLLACETGLGGMRATTTPDTMEHVPGSQIRTSMWVLASEVRELERLLEAPKDGSRETLSQDVRAVLTRMRTAARALDTAGRTTQHPVLNDQLDRFVLQIDRAIRAVDRNPPNYFRASTVAGSCFLCHGSGGNEFTRRSIGSAADLAAQPDRP